MEVVLSNWHYGYCGTNQQGKDVPKVDSTSTEVRFRLGLSQRVQWRSLPLGDTHPTALAHNRSAHQVSSGTFPLRVNPVQAIIGRFARILCVKLRVRRMPTSNRRMPTSNRRMPTSNRRMPTSNKRMPTSNRRMPTSNRRMPTSNRRMPTSSKRMPTSNRRRLVTYGRDSLKNRRDSFTRRRNSLTNGRDSFTPAHGQ